MQHPFVCTLCLRRPNRDRYTPLRFGRRNRAYIGINDDCEFCNGSVEYSHRGDMPRPWKLAR